MAKAKVEDKDVRERRELEERADQQRAVERVERKFRELNLVLQRTVEEMVDAASEEYFTGRGYYGAFVPHEEWEEVKAAVKAISDYALEVVRGDLARLEAKDKDKEVSNG